MSEGELVPLLSRFAPTGRLFRLMSACPLHPCNVVCPRNDCATGYCNTTLSAHKGPRHPDKGAETPLWLAVSASGIHRDLSRRSTYLLCRPYFLLYLSPSSMCIRRHPRVSIITSVKKYAQPTNAWLSPLLLLSPPLCSSAHAYISSCFSASMRL